MLQELLKIFKRGDALSGMANDFAAMLKLSREMTATAGAIYFREPVEAGRPDAHLRERRRRQQARARPSANASSTHVSTHGNTPGPALLPTADEFGEGRRTHRRLRQERQ